MSTNCPSYAPIDKRPYKPLPKEGSIGIEYLDGIKTYICYGRGWFRFDTLKRSMKPGDRVSMYPKLYEIQKDYSFKRINKKRR